MARAIDASELMAEIQACSWDSEQDKERAEDLVLGMPTLTPPNEPLICDGCLWAEMDAHILSGVQILRSLKSQG